VEPVRVLQLGSEDSGNRLVHRILQTADPAIETTGRSLPHGEGWPDVDALIEEFRPDKILIVWRDKTIQTRAAAATGHTDTLAEAIAERERAEWLLAGVRGDVRVQVYELLVKDPLTQIANLGDWLGVSLTMPEVIYDANTKHER
jgi:hypothetical protein